MTPSSLFSQLKPGTRSKQPAPSPLSLPLSRQDKLREAECSVSNNSELISNVISVTLQFVTWLTCYCFYKGAWCRGIVSVCVT